MTLSGVIVMKALGINACPGPCATTRATGSRYAATSMPPPANADTRRNDRRSSWNAGFFVISTLVGFGLQGRLREVQGRRQHCKIRASQRYMNDSSRSCCDYACGTRLSPPAESSGHGDLYGPAGM